MKKTAEMEEESAENKVSTISTTPTKRIIYSNVAVCMPRNIVTELQDNLVDYVAELCRNGSLKHGTIRSDFNFSPDGISIRWNKGIPAMRRMALLTPGMSKSEDKGSIGTWSMGGKIALHACGDDIKIRTCTPDDERITQYHFMSGWLWDSNGDFNEATSKDWTVQQLLAPLEQDRDFTEIIVKNPAQRVHDEFDPTSSTYADKLEALLKFLGETYGLTFDKWPGVRFEMRVNGQLVKPITHSAWEDLKDSLAFVPGFEPTEHVYNYQDLSIRVIVGSMAKLDDDGGMYFYGNNKRLFASRERNPTYLDGINTLHPQERQWQMHIFFEGDTELIPWHSPLKDGVNYGHPVMLALKKALNQLPQPYIQLVLATHAPFRQVFTDGYSKLSVEQRPKELFKGMKQEQPDEHKLRSLFSLLPKVAQEGRALEPEIIEEFDRGDLLASLSSKVHRTQPKWAEGKAKEWLRRNNIQAQRGQERSKTVEGRIDMLWLFNEFIDPNEIRSQPSSRTAQSTTTTPGVATATVGGVPQRGIPLSPNTRLDDEPQGTESICGRIPSADVRRLRVATHASTNSDIVRELAEVFFAASRLTATSGLPVDLTGVTKIKDRLERLRSHYEGSE